MDLAFLLAILKGAAGGALAAAWIDIAAFRKWQDWNEFMTYKWGLATWRWFQGFVIGGGAVVGGRLLFWLKESVFS